MAAEELYGVIRVVGHDLAQKLFVATRFCTLEVRDAISEPMISEPYKTGLNKTRHKDLGGNKNSIRTDGSFEWNVYLSRVIT